VSGGDPDFLVTDPLETLQRVLRREVFRADRRRLELAEIGNALLQLSKQSERPAKNARGSVWEPVSADLAPSLIERLLEATDGPLRTCVVGLQAGPGLDPDIVQQAQARLAEGKVQKAVYPIDVYDQPDGRAWMQAWAEVGEEQRICEEPPSDFAVFGDTAVLAAADWGSTDSDFVLIREPMIVRAFIQLFDRTFERALPIPSNDEVSVGEDALLRLLAAGLKDEAIGRYLGCSLRTVRRRIAALMATHGAETRFQLGAAVAARGLVPPPRAPHGTHG
jgi:hypothetical protein